MGAQHCSVKNGKKGKGKSHAQYVVGQGKYSEREDVLGVITGNLPEWAPDGVTFFAAADKHERLNGRSYKEVEFAIPRDVEDPVAYAEQFAQKLLGKDYPFLAGVHSKLAADGLPNTHCHLMFSERKLDGHERGPEHFFKRANAKNPALGGCGKDREMNKREWVQAVRDLHQAHALSYGVKLDMRSNAARGLGPPEPKIGPAAQRGPIDTYREKIIKHVTAVRADRKPKALPTPAPAPAPRPAPAPAPARKSYYHPDRIAAREKKEKEMATKQKQDLRTDNESKESVTRITLQTLKNQFGVDISPADKLSGEALERWSEEAEDKVFEKEFKEFQSSLPSKPDVLQQNPDPSLSEMLKASFEKMLRWIKSAGGSHKEIDTDTDAEHYGQVVQLDDMHCVQHMGKGIYSIHRLDELDNVPALNDPKTEIKYAGGVGVVSGKALDKDRGR